MARKIVFNAEENKQFQFVYQALLFPKKELNSREEDSLGRLLDAFEAVGKTKEVRTQSDTFTSYEIDKDVVVKIEDESDFKLMKDIVEATSANGLWVRDKKKAVEKLNSAPKLEVEIKDA